MITKILTCDWCGKTFHRTKYPSYFKIYKKNYCCKRHAIWGAKAEYRPSKLIVTRKDGRKMIRKSNHPNANQNGQIPLSHLIMERIIGRHLEKNEVVHHIDFNPGNDNRENLQLMKLGEHVSLHNNLKLRDANGRFKKMSKM